jgi:FMN reductase
MSRKLKVVAVSGSLQRPSRTNALVEAILAELEKSLPVEIKLIELGNIAADFGAVTNPKNLPQHIKDEIAAVESADLLVVATPVYRASFTGLFKHFFDFVHHEALIDVPVLLAATGGSERHALVIEHQLRPLFSFFQSITLPVGVYAAEAELESYRVSSPALQQRIELAVKKSLPFLTRRDINLNQDIALAANA